MWVSVRPGPCPRSKSDSTAPPSRPQNRTLPAASKLSVTLGKSRTDPQEHSRCACGKFDERRQPPGMDRRIISKKPVDTRRAADPESRSAAAPIGSCALKSTSVAWLMRKKLKPRSTWKPTARTLVYQRSVSDANMLAASWNSPWSGEPSRIASPKASLGRGPPSSVRTVQGVSSGCARQKRQKKPSTGSESDSFHSSPGRQLPRPMMPFRGSSCIPTIRIWTSWPSTSFPPTAADAAAPATAPNSCVIAATAELLSSAASGGESRTRSGASGSDAVPKPTTSCAEVPLTCNPSAYGFIAMCLPAL
mmetsp:Transcript_6038/g.17890  ORF Transcript_6038/g.17890 Transcript_6038/m.17890 type:complete len:306 (-) Transcript_6038:165-1082(-)